MLRQHVQVGVMRVDWSRWRGLGATGRVSPRFAHLCAQGAVSDGRAASADVPGRDAINAADPAERPRLLQTLVRDKLAHVLGIASDRLDFDKPLLQLGIDSLMAVELRNWLEGELRVNLPIVELMRSPSLSGLADTLAHRIESMAAARSFQSGRNGSSHAQDNLVLNHMESAPDELLAHIDELSGEQLDSVLARLLDERGEILEAALGRAGEK